jgi:hypothetical protein
MTLDEFIKKEKNNLVKFYEYYLKNNSENPQLYPLYYDHIDDWYDEFFIIFKGNN